MYLEPGDVRAYPEAIRAILDADLIILGPGSLYTSIMPNLLVRDIAQAIRVQPGAQSLCVQRRHSARRDGSLFGG